MARSSMISGFHAVSAGRGQLYLTASCAPSDNPRQAAVEAYSQIAATLRESGAEIVHERILGSLPARDAVLASRDQTLRSKGLPSETPVTYVEGHPVWGGGLAGVLIRAIAPPTPGDRVWTIAQGPVPQGRGWRRNGQTFLLLQNLQGLADQPTADNAPPSQAARMIARADRLLRRQGSSYRDVVRTWFYLTDILGWYDRFNQVRDEQYRELGLLADHAEDRVLPASTGIGCTPGSAGGLDLLAVPRNQSSPPAIERLMSPVQPEAHCYGSAFSRGMLIRESDVDTIQISGTAAIDEAGLSMHPDDARAQIQCTFEKAETLLATRGARLSDLCSATLFIKRPADATILPQVLADLDLSNLPAVCVVADVCRDELLFEIDGEAKVDLDSKAHGDSWAG